MNHINQIAILPVVLGFIVSLVITPLCVWLFERLGWTVDPKKNPHPAHIHDNPVPKGGGIPIFIAVVLAGLAFLPLDKHWVAISLAMLLTLIIGVIDDVKGINPYFRLGTNILAAVIVVASGIGIAFVSSPFGGMIDLSNWKWEFWINGSGHQIWFIADLFAILWIPFLMNTINWSSGVDGQASGVVAIAAAVIGMISLNYGADITQWPVAILAFATAGAFAGLAFWHFYPQKIMPGYSATSMAGLLLGVLSILSTAKVGTLLVVLGIPVVDFVYIFSRRILAGKSPVWGDKGHLHHRLLDLGWKKPVIALTYWAATAILGVVALTVNARMKLIAMTILLVIMAGFLVWTYYFRYLRQLGRDSG